jgi:hypothetical protein
MNSYYNTLAGSGTANILTVVAFFVLNCIRKRLNKSKCESHCYIFDCEAQLDDLKHVKSEVVTQRGLIQNVIELLDTKSVISRQSPPRMVLPAIVLESKQPPGSDDD